MSKMTPPGAPDECLPSLAISGSTFCAFLRVTVFRSCVEKISRYSSPKLASATQGRSRPASGLPDRLWRSRWQPGPKRESPVFLTERKKDSDVSYALASHTVAQAAADLTDGPEPHDVAGRAAQTNCALLLTGETGSGKGHLARWIHDHGPRAAGPFVPVNCGAIPDSLIDSHLFGHAKGSFSGATGDHLGLIRAAAEGTLLLDEICELPLSAQARLLRLLEEREVQPVGYSKPLIVDVRIIAASNHD